MSDSKSVDLREFKIANDAVPDPSGSNHGYVVWHKKCNYRLPLRAHVIDNLDELVALAEDHKCPTTKE